MRWIRRGSRRRLTNLVFGVNDAHGFAGLVILISYVQSLPFGKGESTLLKRERWKSIASEYLHETGIR